MPKKKQSFRSRTQEKKLAIRRKRLQKSSDSDSEGDFPRSRPVLPGHSMDYHHVHVEGGSLHQLPAPTSNVTHYIRTDNIHTAGPSTAAVIVRPQSSVLLPIPHMVPVADPSAALGDISPVPDSSNPLLNVPPQAGVVLPVQEAQSSPALDVTETHADNLENNNQIAIPPIPVQADNLGDNNHIANPPVRLQPRQFRSRQYRAFRFLPDVMFLEELAQHDLGSMTASCQNCSAMYFPQECTRAGYSLCCQKGKISLPRLNESPQILRELLVGNTQNCKNFKQNIRGYNSALAFASFGAQTPNFPGRGPYCFTVHGQIYHRTAPPHAQGGQVPRYAQLYFLDSSEATAHRHAENLTFSPDILQELDEMIRGINPYYQSFRMLKDVEAEQIRVAHVTGEHLPEIYLALERDANTDLRRYNKPTVTTEISCVFFGEEPPNLLDIKIYPHGQGLTDISKLSPNLDPMVYPLIFPYGEAGWHINMPHVGPNRTAVRNTVTHMQFYSYRLAIRQGFSILHSSGKLFQQYVVDGYVKAEASRLWFIRQNQQTLRAEQYKGLRDYVQSRADEQNTGVGKIVVLPSSFIGSQRSMVQLYLDAMAVVRKYGKPDLFITFTCNTMWPEIRNGLEAWQEVHNRPDLIAKVFHLKLNSLLEDINGKHVLGVPVAYTHVVEFQKRGLPHAHILIILNSEDRIRDAEDVDTIVRAEIPHPTQEKRLYEIVSKTMIHGPCGTAYPSAACMQNGECNKGFPKTFHQQTVMNQDGYPEYRRRDNNHVITLRGTDLDNRHVVPYNPLLLLKYNAHINVEVCSSIRAVKYLYKYIHKGYDCATVSVTSRDPIPNLEAPNLPQPPLQWDEIKTFLDCRYIGSPEAAWRLFGYDLHGKSITVIRLPIHLPDFQTVFFRENEEERALLAAQEKATQLQDWFALNSRDPAARPYLYVEIVQHYVWLAKDSKWKKRVKGGFNTIARLPNVSPRDEETFHLRMLLLHIPGACSFDNLKTVDGEVCSTFKAAARKLHLLEDDNEWIRCLTQASRFMMPSAMRLLFVVICVFGRPDDPLSLWDSFKLSMSEDFGRHHQQAIAFNLSLLHLSSLFNKHSTTCQEFNLPEPLPDNTNVFEEEQIDVRAEQALGQEMLLTLNDSQKHFTSIVFNAVREYKNGLPHSKAFFLDGPGGTGKTYTYNTLIHVLRGRGESVVAVAWTGIASTMLIGGATCHSTFKFPVPITDNSTCNITVNSPQASVLRDASIIIWDEAPMASYHALQAVDICLQDIMKNKSLFGGKVVVLGGDFRQVLPILPHAKKEVQITTSIRFSRMWNEIQLHKLQRNMRVDSQSAAFSNWLLKLGDGILDTELRFGPECIRIPDQCVVENDIVLEVFGNDILQHVSGRAILCPKNDDAFLINEQIIKQLPGRETVYFSVDKIHQEPQDGLDVPMEYVNSLTPSGLAPHKLTLKVGVVVMLLRNLQTAGGLCNGTRMSILKMLPNVLLCKIISGPSAGKTVFLSRMSQSPSPTEIPFKMTRVQFPIRVAFAITINKAQGQTFDRIGIFLPQPVFSHGQLYVAFSRVRNFATVKVLVQDYKDQQGKKRNLPGVYTKNVVYSEILL